MAKPGSGWNAAVEATLRIAPVAGRDHRLQERAGQVVHGLDVQRDDAPLALDAGLEQRRDGPEAGVVAHAHDRALAGLEPRDQGAPRRRVDQVARLDVGVHAVGEPQLLRERLQPVGAAGAEHDVVAAPCQLARELGADAGGRPGDQDGGVDRRRR